MSGPCGEAEKGKIKLGPFASVPLNDVMGRAEGGGR